MLSRILTNTRKQISRSGWTAWASVSVMTLAFLVAIIFGALALVSNLYINSIETKNNLLVFFNEGMDTEIINRLSEKWRTDVRIKNVSFTSEEAAYEIYSDYTARVQPEIYAVLKTKEDKKLPSSLDVQIWSLDKLSDVKNLLQTDIDNELKELIIIPSEAVEEDLTETSETLIAEEPLVEETKYKFSEDDPTKSPINLKVDDETLNKYKDAFVQLRIGGFVVIVFLFIVIFFFTFMAAEFRLYNQMEEIGVMQLVGGSLLFIRAPYVLEGGFYGFIGAIISSLLIGATVVYFFVVKANQGLSLFLYETFGLDRLQWPQVSAVGWVGVILLLGFVGFALGAISSFLSIRRYIR